MKKAYKTAGKWKFCMAAMLSILVFAGCGNKEAETGGIGANAGKRAENRTESQTGEAVEESAKKQAGEQGRESEQEQAGENTEETTEDGQQGKETAALTEAEETAADLGAEPKNLFAYERKSGEDGEYLVITGLSKEWEEYLAGYGKAAPKEEEVSLAVCIPEKISGITVKEIGAGAFENCNFVKAEFPDYPVHVKERAFAGNRKLWALFAKDVGTVLEDGALEGCRESFLLCYGVNPQGKENLVRGYAQENGMDSMEIILSKEPVVRYPAEPLILQPEVRNFFYGDYYDGGTDIYQAFYEENWCSFEENEQAPNFGYSDWQWPGCSSWCAVIDFEQEAEASSELESFTGRYAAENVLRQDRYGAWAEGAEGTGIGESITYRQSCTYPANNKWEVLRWDFREPETKQCDGFMRYSEVCIVNGYAKDQKTWEENGRVKKLLMYVEGKPYAYLELEDTILPQYFQLPEDDIKVLNGGMAEFRFEIEDVYAGTVYEDTCLTGIVMEFTGRHSH